MMGRKTEVPTFREPAGAVSRWGNSAHDCSRSLLPEPSVGRDGQAPLPVNDPMDHRGPVG